MNWWAVIILFNGLFFTGLLLVGILLIDAYFRRKAEFTRHLFFKIKESINAKS